MTADTATEMQTRQLVVFTLGAGEYCVPVTLVQEIIRYTGPGRFRAALPTSRA